jgi:ribonuclease III
LIDLHVHSTASDGSLSPGEILHLARKNGIKAIALTDHDTIAGVKELFNLTSPTSVEFISGVEISCAPPGGFESLGSVHMLGYGFSVYDRQLNQVLERAVMAREERNPRIIQKLRDLGIDISMDQVRDRFGADQTGRPHIAELLKEKGVVASFKEAFDLYLGKNKPAYVDKFKISCESAVKMIRDAGGLPVLAHPGLLDFDGTPGLESFVDLLAEAGLEGLEVFYTDHDPDQIRQYLDLARKKDLLVTGGSDFHGAFNQGVDLGRGKGDLDVKTSLFTALTNRLAEVRALPRLDILESYLGYEFKDLSHLSNALCHRSFLNENQETCATDNERLEFLGDAVLGLCVGHLLMEEDPTKHEGELSKLRSSLVSEPGLAHMARQIDLGRFVKLGKGEALSGGADKNSILSDTFEAVIAAVYLDAGFDRTREIVTCLFEEPVHQILANHRTMDYKSAIQEYAQEHFNAIPEYRLEKESGPDHDKTFEISLMVNTVYALGRGKTKKAAEQDAARNALKSLKSPPCSPS